MTLMQDIEATEAPPEPGARAWRVLGLVRDYGVVVLLLGLVVALTANSPVFLTQDNLSNLVQQWAFIGIMACAGTIAIIARGFDLSVASTFATSGVVAALVANDHGTTLGLAAGVGAGALIGAVNGWIVTVAKVDSFLATLGTGFLLQGVALHLTGGLLIVAEDPSFTELGRGELLGLPHINWVYLVIVAVSAVVLAYFTFGRYVYATGTNPEAARLSGVPVDRIRWLTFFLSGTFAAIAGVLSASQSGAGQSSAGEGYQLLTIAAVVLGGTSIMGGRGAIWRAVVGTLTLAVIANGGNLLNLTPSLLQVIQGSVIVLAVSLDAVTRRR